MRTVYLPYALGRTIKALCYIGVLILDIVNFVLTPFTMLQFKAHMFMLSFSGLWFLYLHFIVQKAHAIIIAATAFIIASTTIILIKLARKMLKHIRQNLMHVFYAPVGVCFNIRSTRKATHPVGLTTLKISNDQTA